MSMEVSPSIRRRPLLDNQRSQRSVLNSTSNLRELMRVRDEDDRGHSRESSLTGLTLGAVLGCDGVAAPTPMPTRRVAATPVMPVQSSPSNRTLLDIINDEESGAAYRGLIVNSNEGGSNKGSWKSFKDRLKLGRASVAWSSSSSSVSPYHMSLQDCQIQISRPLPPRPNLSSRLSSFRDPQRNMASARLSSFRGDPQINTSTPTPPERNNNNVGDSVDVQEELEPPVVMPLSDALAAEREERCLENEQSMHEGGDSVDPSRMANEISEVVAEPVRISLMALLEETDRQAGLNGSTYSGLLGGEDLEEEEEEEDMKEREGGGVGESVCCVCMVRHKGAAFIPCGHTFCRLCSRELWVSRGNCPLCNSYILEILDIF